MNMNFTIKDLLSSINGTVKGNNNFYCDFTGRFTLLNDAGKGDIVIRHWVNGKGIEIAVSKNISCLITQSPKDGAIEKAEELNFPLIIVDKIELANSYALKWTINKYSPNSSNIIITGTNGKSTTSHLIYHILKSAGFKVFTNTDAESEFNTLIDPMVSKLISDNVIGYGKLDFLVIEVSEVQGWLGSLMKNHGYLMSKAINPSVGVITNIAMDHIGLVNSIDDVYNEISKVPEAITNGYIVLNKDDCRLMTIDINENTPFYFSLNKLNSNKNNIYYDNKLKAIIYNNSPILENKDLPFTSNHFIQNILGAISACISLNIPISQIIKGVKSYNSLKRRFSKLNEKPLIIDDFAHNPDGIKATIEAASKLVSKDNYLHVICSIRGSRGEDINRMNAEMLSKTICGNMKLAISSSCDVVDNLNYVEDNEKEVFFSTLKENNIEFTYFNKLFDVLATVYNDASKEDVILLIGAQGMDPAEELLKDIILN